MKSVGTETGDDRADGKTGITADGKAAQSLSFQFSGNFVDGARRFRMVNGRAEAAEHTAEKYQPVVIRETEQCNADTANQRAERNEPRFGYLVGIVAENGLRDGRQQHIGKNERRRVLIIQIVRSDKIRQKGRDSALRPVHRKMPHGEQIYVGI